MKQSGNLTVKPKSKVSIVRCSTYDSRELYAALTKSFDLLGGINSIVKCPARVLVKPNLLMAKGPEFPICTHPEFIRVVVRILKDNGCEVFIGDGPSVWGGKQEDVKEVYEKTGIIKIAGEEGCKVVYFDKSSWFDKFPLASILNEVDCVVSLPKFKTHNFTVLTGGVKNLFGLVSNSFKIKLHRDFFDPEDFSSVLVDIYEKVRPALTVVDGIVALEGDGPATGGVGKKVGLILASSDAVAVDSILSRIMGISPQDVPINRIAAKRNLGAINRDDIECLGENLQGINVSPFKLASSSIVVRIPRPIARILRGFIKFYPRVLSSKCKRCLKCIKVCPKGAISFNEKKTKIQIDYDRCISCFCCQETCPNAAFVTRKSLLARLIGV